jgi:hypothetical protein
MIYSQAYLLEAGGVKWQRFQAENSHNEPNRKYYSEIRRDADLAASLSQAGYHFKEARDISIHQPRSFAE